MSCQDGIPPGPTAELKISLPGGAEIIALPAAGTLVGSELAKVQSILSMAGIGLAVIRPVLNIIDAVLAIFDLLKKVLDPPAFVQALPEVTKKLERLATLAPALAVPAMVLSMVRVCAAYLRALVDQLQGIAAQVATAEAALAAAVAAGDAALQTEIQCGLDALASATEHAADALGPVQIVLDGLTSVMGFIPNPAALPALPSPAGMTASALAEALQPIVDALDAIQI
jgi:hypothetical protein